MKKYLPISARHEKLVGAFTNYLHVLGHQSVHCSQIAVVELLNRVEGAGKSVDETSGEDVMDYYNYLLTRPNYTRGGGLSLHTVRGYMYQLKLFFIYTEKRGITGSNPLGSLEFPAVPKTSREVLSVEEMGQLYEVCETKQDEALLGLFYGCGLRRVEAEKLNIRDVDLKGMCLYVRSGKGRKRRMIPLSKKVKRDLEAYRFEQRPGQETRWTKQADREAFMLNKMGTRMRGCTYWKSLKGLLKKTSIEKRVSLHHLRHSIATHLLAEGMQIEQVRDFLGHEYLETTQIYTRVGSRQLDSLL